MQERRLRIVFATPEYVTELDFDGGLANYLHRLAVALAAMGHDVQVLTLSRIESARFEHEGVKVHRIMLTNGWQVINKFTRYRLATTIHWLNFSAQVYRKLKRLHRQEGIDLVQFPNYSCCGLFSMLLLPIPHVLRASSEEPFFHDPAKEHTLDFKLLERMERFQLRRTHRVFSPSLGLQQTLLKKHNLEVAVINSPMYLETSAWDSSIFEKCLPVREYLLFFGRFERRKGFEILVQALAKALERNEGISAVLIGRDVSTSAVPSMAEYARSRCGRFGSRFLVLDQLPHPQLYPIVSRAKLVVLPSLVDNLPNAGLESMALAKAVIGTETSLDELISDEVTGFLVAAGDVDALVEKILYAWDHPGLKAIGEAAKKKVLDFSRDKTTEALLNYYAEVLQA